MASSEVCMMETSEVEENHKFCESEGMASDISGFLSNSCLETDEKGDPFSSDNTLNFSGDSSRFDSECILSSSLAESGSIQQTTACDSAVSSFLSGENFASSSMLPEGSVLLYSMASSTAQKSMNTLTQFPSPNFMLVNRGEAKGGAWPVDQKMEFLSPIQLLTPVSQSHPVVIGNSSAAAFVKNVLKEIPTPPSSSLSASVSATNPVSLPPGFVLLNSTLLPQLTLVQSAAGSSSPPWLIQLPSVTDTGPLGAQLSAVSLDILTSTSNTMATAPVIASSDTGVSIHSAISSSSSSVLNYGSTTASVPSYTATGTEREVSSVNIRNTVDSVMSCVRSSASSLSQNGASIISSVSDSAFSASHTGDKISTCVSSSTPSDSTSYADPKACVQPILISCMQPNAKGSRGMQQILEHFLQQNRKTEAKSATQATYNNSDQKQPNSTGSASEMVVDAGNAGSNLVSNEVKPQMIMVPDLKDTGELSSFTVPGLGGRNNSVVLVLRKNASQVMDGWGLSSVSLASSSSQASSSGIAAGLAPYDSNHANSGQLERSLIPDSASGLNVGSGSPDDAEEDEVDGSSASATRVSLSGGSTQPAMVSPANNMSTLPQPTTSVEQMEDVSPAMNTSTSGAPLTNAASDVCHPSAEECVHWMQIQLPSNPAEENKEGGDDIQKLIPLTVSEKLAPDICRPIIICVVQEDGEMQHVNINPMEVGAAGGKWADSSTAPTATPGNSHWDGAADAPPADPVARGIDIKMGSDPTLKAPLQGADQLTPAANDSQGCRVWQEESPQTGSEECADPAVSTKTPADSKSKRFRCDLCTAVFTRLGNYTRHRKIHTLNLKEDKHFKCPYCERPFLQRCDMKRHMAIHTNEHPFHCQTCGKGYIRKSDLVVHERFHSKDRAFKCETCGRCFYQSGDLRRHKRYVHSEESHLVWSCSHCHRKYTREVTLIRHMKTVHNDLLLLSLPSSSHSDSGQTVANKS